MGQTLFLTKHSADTNWDILVYYTQWKNLLFILLHKKRNIQNTLIKLIPPRFWQKTILSFFL